MKQIVLALMIGWLGTASMAEAGNPREISPVLREVSPKEFLKLSQAEGAVILDVRDTSDVKDMRMDNAIALPEAEITKEKMSEIAPDKSKPLLLICNYSVMPRKAAEITRMPVRMSAMDQAAGKLLPLGYQKIYGLYYVDGGKDLELLPFQPAKKGHH